MPSQHQLARLILSAPISKAGIIMYVWALYSQIWAITSKADILVSITSKADILVSITSKADILVSITSKADILVSIISKADILVSITYKADIVSIADIIVGNSHATPMNEYQKS